MSLGHYLVGNKVVMVGSCSTVDPITDVETPADSATVTFYRVLPNGVLITYVYGVAPEVAKLATGVYGCTVSVDQPGRESWRYQTTGDCEAAAEDAFDVIASGVI